MTQPPPGCPVSFDSETGYWRVRDRAASREALLRPREFVPSNALTAVTELSAASLRILQDARFALPPILASNATHSHSAVRHAVTRFFTPATVAASEGRIRELVRERIARARIDLDAHRSVDLVESVIESPPAVLLLEMIGIDLEALPPPGIRQLKRWSRDSLELFWGWPSPERQLELADCAADFYRWLIDRVRADSTRGTGIFGALHDIGLTQPEICSLGYFLLIAGQETTSQLASIALVRLLEKPREWDAIVADQTGAARHVRRVLAAESSVPTWRRQATRDTVLAGVTIPAGAELVLELTGNGEDPDTLDYGLAFGVGIHRCVGAKLAELEARVIVEECTTALPDIRLVESGGSPDWVRLLSFQAPATIVVARDDASAARPSPCRAGAGATGEPPRGATAGAR